MATTTASQKTLEELRTFEEYAIYPVWALITASACAVIIAVLGFCGNLLTILALPYSSRLRNASTWFVVNLAAVETIFCLTILPMSAAHLLFLAKTDMPLFSDDGCRVFVFLRYVTVQAELLSIAAIAVNRCVLIGAPKKYPHIYSRWKTVGVISSIWVISIVVMLIPLLGMFGKFSYNYATQECDFADNTEFGKLPRKVFLVIGFFLPCIIIIISYSYIFYKARKSANKVQERSQSSLLMNSTQQSQQQQTPRPATGLRSRDIRIARTIGVIFLAFLICCTPVSVMHYIYQKASQATLLLLLHPVYWLQYCINIFVYVFMNKQYRDAYINYISRWWPRFRTVTRERFNWAEEATSESLTRKISRQLSPNNTTVGSSAKVKFSNSDSKRSKKVSADITATPCTESVGHRSDNNA